MGVRLEVTAPERMDEIRKKFDRLAYEDPSVHVDEGHTVLLYTRPMNESQFLALANDEAGVTATRQPC